jgi:hypothetical protein
MRRVTLTAYYTPYERNPSFIGDAPNYDGYATEAVQVWNGTTTETIYVDHDFRYAIAHEVGGTTMGIEGFGKIFRWRDNPSSPCDTGIAPPADKAYLRWNSRTHRFEFAAQPLNAQNPPAALNINSTARNTGTGLSYFNMRWRPNEADGAYTIPGLQQYGGMYIDDYTTPPYKAQDPPDNRIVDDSGSTDNPAWLDIYFYPTNQTFGVSPKVVRGDPRAPDSPIRVFR